jgi:hypothetical protein
MSEKGVWPKRQRAADGTADEENGTEVFENILDYEAKMQRSTAKAFLIGVK